ncbi:MAG: cytochrome P450 [Solirubrobacteraceae bacterium]
MPARRLAARSVVTGLPSAVAFERRPLQTLERRRADGDMFPLTSLIAGGMLVLAAPELARQVLHAPSGRFLAGAANQRILPPLPANTLLALDGAAHRERRSQLAPLFGGAPLKSIADQLDDLISGELDRWPIGRPFAVLPRLRSLTFSIAARLLLGVTDETDLAELKTGLASGLGPYAMLSGYPTLKRLRSVSPQAAAGRGRERFAQGLVGVLRGRELPFSADEAFALLLAGRDTTATALAWALMQLAHLPGVQRMVADQAAADDRGWVDAVIHETLRVHPPLVDIVRQPAETVRLAGQHLQAGTLLMICPALVGRSNVHPDPGNFNPERFLGRHPDPLGWIPFGGGERRCLGAPLAMLELREVLARVIARFELTPGAPRLEQPRLYGTAVVPSKGGEIVLTPRS